MPSANQVLVLVRHGVTDWNESGRLMGRGEIEINERGRAQAEALAEALSDLPLTGVISSPQRRTRETAAAIARRHGLEVREEEALAEVWVGRWQGKTFAEIREDPDLPRAFSDPGYRSDAIEAVVDVQERVVAFTTQLCRGAQGTMVLVSHGDPLRLLLAHYLAIPLAAFRTLVISPASASVLRMDGWGPRLVLLNWRPGDGKLVIDSATH